MKKVLLFALLSAFIFSYSFAATTAGPGPRHKMSRLFKNSKGKHIVYGHDRARKKVKYRRQGQDYYSYANSRSYLRMMGKAINGNKAFR